MIPLPLQEFDRPRPRQPHPPPLTAAAAQVHSNDALANDYMPWEIHQGPKILTLLMPHFDATIATTHAKTAANIISELLITKSDLAMIYMPPTPYYDAFKEVLDICRFDLSTHYTAGLCLAHVDSQLFLGGMVPSTPGAKIPGWRSWIKGAWLIKLASPQFPQLRMPNGPSKNYQMLATHQLHSFSHTRRFAPIPPTMASRLCPPHLFTNTSMIR
jgi:hypothetical protein